MTTATACVFAFKGTAYWGRPGYDFRPDQVREDFGKWRTAQSRDGKRIAAWLVRNGYRMAWRKIGRGADAVAYEEYWVRVDVLGGPEVKYVDPRDIRAALQALQKAAQMEDEPRCEKCGAALVGGAQLEWGLCEKHIEECEDELAAFFEKEPTHA